VLSALGRDQSLVRRQLYWAAVRQYEESDEHDGFAFRTRTRTRTRTRVHSHVTQRRCDHGILGNRLGGRVSGLERG
jgi:hypothetical protein